MHVQIAEKHSLPLVLIADDSESSRELLRFILHRIGCEILEAEDGEAAIYLAIQSEPVLIILDLNMPKQDGYAVAGELRKLTAFEATPIVALSAGISQADPVKIRESGFTTFLAKPVTPAKLRACVSGFLPSA